MNITLISVNTTSKENRARLYFKGDWLAPMGFLPDALVQALPEPGGMVIRLCDENIPKYSALVQETAAKGGKLIFGTCEQGTSLVTSGDYIYNGGLALGDSCVALYDYGLIRVRKLPPQTKIILAKRKQPKSRMICGNWLLDIGFIPEALIAVSAEPGKITLSLQNNRIDSYAALVKHARIHKMRLIQVMSKTDLICIAIPDISLKKAGLAIDEPYYAQYDHGLITLSRPDFQALGF